MTDKLWVCGKIKSKDKWKLSKSWEFIGVFNSEILARDACRNKYYFIAPVELNFIAPDETVEWPGAYYPLFNNEIEYVE